MSSDNAPLDADAQQELIRLRARVEELETFQTQASHHRLLTEQVPAILWSTDVNLRFTSASGAALRTLGIEPCQVLGTTVRELLGVLDPDGSPMPEHRRALEGHTVAYDYPWLGSIYRCLLEPLYDAAGRVIGTVGVGVVITERINLEAALRQRIRAESLLTSVSTEFIAMHPAGIDCGIKSALKRIGEFAGADRAYVFQVTPDGRWCSNTHEWCDAGIESVIDDLQDVDLETMPWWKKHLERLETISIPDVASLPATAAAERTILEQQEIRSLLAMPLAAAGRLIGFLGFDAVRARKSWTPEDATLLKTCGEMIAGAMERGLAEQALRESEAVNRSIIQAIPDLLFRMDREGTILTCCAKEPSKLAAPVDQLVGKRLRDLGLMDIDALYANAISQVFESDSVSMFEYHAPPERGSRYWEVRVARCGRDEVMALVRDITARKTAELDVKERDRFLSSLISNLSGCVYRARNDRDWTAVFISEGISEVTGYSAEEFLSGNRTLGGVVHPDDVGHVRERVQDAINARHGFQISYRMVAADGQVRWVWERGSGVYGPGGEVEAIEGFLTDITELKKAEESLQRSHSLLRLTLDEMDHRVRNNLASIAALLDITAVRHETVVDFRDAMKSRVLAMAEVHTMLSRNRWIANRIDQLLDAIVPDDLGAVIDAAGPEVQMSPRQATALGMVFHELIANSLKYGALRRSDGRLTVTWTSEQLDDDIQRVNLAWREDCGEPLDGVNGRSLGTSLIEGIVKNDLRGEACLSYQPNGADHRLQMKLKMRNEVTTK